jgi:4-amino-4-deoxy-L-arabinose transferase-like glycosyltransferase
VNRAFALRVLAVAIGGLALRVVYIVLLTPHQAGIGDFYYYQDLATALANGFGYVDPGSAYAGQAEPTAAHGPLWPELLSLVSRTGLAGSQLGEHGPGGYVAHRLTGAVVGTGTVVAIGYLGRRAAGARVGLIAAAIAAAYPVLIAADGSLLTESLFGLCVAVAMLIAYRVLDAPSGWWALALGLAIGLAALTRAEGLLLAPLLALPVVWRRDTTAGVVAARLGLVVLGVAVAVGPWTIRNWARFDRVVLVSNNNGSVIAGANCPAVYYGRNVGLWDYGCVAVGGSGNEAEAAARQRRKGIDYARDHAGRVPVVMIVRILRAFDLYQPWRGAGYNEGRAVTASRIGIVVYWLLLPLAVVGAVFLRRRDQALRVLLAPVLLVVLVSAFGWGITRFRHAAEIPIVILAAVALARLLPLDGARRLGRDVEHDPVDLADLGDHA